METGKPGSLAEAFSIIVDPRVAGRSTHDLVEMLVMQYGDAPDPFAGQGQVLIEVHAASVNAAIASLETLFSLLEYCR